MQTRRRSAFEALINIAVGFGFAIGGNWIYLYANGFTLDLSQVMGLGLFMTVLSFIRQYFVRRFFNWLDVKYPTL